jgi:IS30 family transposase
MARRPNLTREQVELIVELRERGWGEGRIATKLGVSEGSVGWALLREGAEAPHTRAKALPPVPLLPIVYKRGAYEVRRFSVLDDKELLALEATGLNACAIAKRIGRQPNTVTGRLRTLARHQARFEAIEEKCAHG